MAASDEKVVKQLNVIMLEMTRKPYASIAVLLLFKYFVIFDVQVKAKEVDPDALGDNVFNILNY